MVFKNMIPKILVLLCCCFSVTAGQSGLYFKNYHYFFSADIENQDEDKQSSNNLANDEFFLGFEAPLFESIQSQWGALVSTASYNYPSQTNEMVLG